MGTILSFVFFTLVAIAFCALGWYFEQRKKPVEIPLIEVPALVLGEVQRRVPELTTERVMKRPSSNSFRLFGLVSGEPIQLKIRLRDGTSTPSIDKVEIQPETRSSHRSLKGKHRIDPSSVPTVVLEQAHRAAEMYGAALEEISQVKAATVQGRNAYDIKGWSGDWRVEVELLDDGELLEVELSHRPDRQRV